MRIPHQQVVNCGAVGGHKVRPYGLVPTQERFLSPKVHRH